MEDKSFYTPNQELLRPDLQNAKKLYDRFSALAKKYQEGLDDDHEIGLIPLLPNGKLIHLYYMHHCDGVIWFSGCYVDGTDAVIITDAQNFSFQLETVSKLSNLAKRIGFASPPVQDEKK